MQKIYFLFLLAFTAMPAVFSQSPGGVSSNLKAWIKSDAAATLTSTDSLDAWTYANDVSKQFTSNAVTFSRPIVMNPGAGTGINFLPVVYFDGNKIMDGPAGAGAPITAGNDAYCVFAVWRSAVSGNFQRVWSQRNPGSFAGDGVSLATWNDNRFGDQLEANPFDQGMLETYTVGKWNITQLNLLNQSSNDLEIRDPSNINGLPLSATTVAGGSSGRSISDILNRLGGRDNSIDEALTGDIAEVIVYDASVTSATVRNQIFSYLALKYGVNKAGDFIASDGTTKIWDSTGNSLYKNSIFGIGRDDNAGLLVNKSNSIETGSGNGTGQNGLGNIILSGASNQDDGEFLLIGNDNGALAESNSDLPASADAGTRRLGREWKVQHTGNVGTVNVDVDLTGLTITGTQPADFFLMVDDDGDGDFTTGHITFFAPGTLALPIVSFTGVTLNNNAVFTLVTFASTATLPVTWKSFSAKPVDNNVILNWSVENNDQGKSFEVQHATDGIHFTTIGTISNNVNVKDYSFTHNNVAGGLHYYRIYQVDMNGKSTYSKIVTVSVKATDFVIRLLNNPVQNNSAEVEIVAAKSVTTAVEIWSVAGAKMISQQQVVNPGTNKINVSMSNIAAGNYLLKVKTGETIQTIRLL
ncbi:MAG: T9SS type A sorting domain-containing protein, partial [Bacteroidota bacterium]